MNKKNIIAIIPARGGSERIKGKNLLDINGKPLLVYSIEHALQSKLVNDVYVTTDSKDISKCAEKHGAKIIIRPDELSGPTCTSESALLHALLKIESSSNEKIDYIVFLQCTSPIRKNNDIDKAIETCISGDLDSVFSACKDLGLFWTRDGDKLTPLNYEPKTRKREQNMPEQFRENGSIFVFTPELLKQENCRMGRKMGIYEMDLFSSFQIDTDDDIKLIRTLLVQ